jgi:hypothetical protein
MWTVLSRQSRRAVSIIPVGTVLLLIGLAWDAILHGIDPSLAAREGVFTLSNPGHGLFAAGLALVVVGSMLLVAGETVTTERGSGRGIWGRAVVAGIGALAAVSIGLAALGGTGLAGGHSHGTPAAAATPCENVSAHSHGNGGPSHHHSDSTAQMGAHAHDRCQS